MRGSRRGLAGPALVAALALVPLAIRAAPETLPAPPLRACARLAEDAQRLHCFDAELARHPLAEPPRLGEEQVERRAPDAAAADRSLTARIASLAQEHDGTYTLKLDNGQVWHQQSVEFFFPLAVGETVRIEKAALGSYRLTRVIEGWNKWTRVSRVN